MSRAAAEARPGSGLPQTSEFAPRLEIPPPTEQNHRLPVELIYFGGSPKRAAITEVVAKTYGIRFKKLPGGDELPSALPTDVAIGKINHGLREELPRIVRPKSNKLRVVVAGDVVVAIDVFRNGKTYTEIKGKPNVLGVELPEIFETMTATAEKTHDPSYYGYSIFTGSEARLLQGLQTKVVQPGDAQFAHIGLYEDAVRYFQTPLGARLFVDATRKFLASPAYRNGHDHRSSPAESCAGFEIATFAMLGALKSIDGSPVTIPALRRVIQLAYFGFDSNIFSLVHPDAPKIVQQYDWTNKVIDHILDNAT